MRVEVGVEDNDGVCTPEVDPDASSTSGEKIYEDIRVRLVELIHSLLTLSLFRVTILQNVRQGVTPLMCSDALCYTFTNVLTLKIGSMEKTYDRSVRFITGFNETAEDWQVPPQQPTHQSISDSWLPQRTITAPLP